MINSTLTHTVFFKLNFEEDSQQAKKFFAAAIALARIPGVQNLRCVRQLSKDNPYQFGICMEFEDQVDYDAYSNHPDHMAFIEKYWLKDVNQYMEVDYREL